MIWISTPMGVSLSNSRRLLVMLNSCCMRGETLQVVTLRSLPVQEISATVLNCAQVVLVHTVLGVVLLAEVNLSMTMVLSILATSSVQAVVTWNGQGWVICHITIWMTCRKPSAIVRIRIVYLLTHVRPLLLYCCRVIALYQTAVSMWCALTRVLICIRIGLAEVTIVASTHKIVCINGTATKIGWLVRLLAFTTILTFSYWVVRAITTAGDQACWHCWAGEWIWAKRLVHVPILVPIGATKT